MRTRWDYLIPVRVRHRLALFEEFSSARSMLVQRYDLGSVHSSGARPSRRFPQRDHIAPVDRYLCGDRPFGHALGFVPRHLSPDVINVEPAIGIDIGDIISNL